MSIIASSASETSAFWLSVRCKIAVSSRPASETAVAIFSAKSRERGIS